MFKQVSTKALYAKLQTFLPSIVTWDVPFTPQEEQARVQFVTQGEGFETLQSVMPQYKKIHWAETLTSFAPFAALIDAPLAPLTQEDDFQVVKLKEKAPHTLLNPAGIRTVVARNLPRDIKDAEIRALFGAHTAAGLRDVYIPRNTDKSSPHFGTLKGFALVKFHTAAESTRAYEALKMLSIRGKNVALEFAKEDR